MAPITRKVSDENKISLSGGYRLELSELTFLANSKRANLIALLFCDKRGVLAGVCRFDERPRSLPMRAGHSGRCAQNALEKCLMGPTRRMEIKLLFVNKMDE